MHRRRAGRAPLACHGLLILFLDIDVYCSWSVKLSKSKPSKSDRSFRSNSHPSSSAFADIRGFEMSNDFRDTNLPFLRCEDSVGSKDPAVIRPSDAGRRREQAKTLQLVGANRRQDEHESNLMIWYSASCNTTPAHPLTHALEIETIDGQSCRIFEIGSIDCG